MKTSNSGSDQQSQQLTNGTGAHEAVNPNHDSGTSPPEPDATGAAAHGSSSDRTNKPNGDASKVIVKVDPEKVAANKKKAAKKDAKAKVQDQLAKIAPKPEPVPRQTPEVRLDLWNKVEAVLNKNFEKPHLDGARAIYAAVAAHRIAEKTPCWNMAVAPSGSTKTQLLDALKGLPSIYPIDIITENALLSGKVDREGKARLEPASFLHRMGKEGIIVCSDFSTYLSQNPKRLAEILSQFRCLHDGEITKQTGSDENPQERSWKGRVTMLVGVTSAIDQHHKTFQALGDRFVRTRWPRVGTEEVGVAAIMQRRHSNANELREAVHAFLFPILSWPHIDPPEISYELAYRMSCLSNLVCLARAYVPRDREERDVNGIVDPEENSRIAQELSQLANGWAILMGRNQVIEEDLALVQRAAWHCIPPVRVAVLQALMQDKQPDENDSCIPRTTVNRAADDLVAIGLAEVDETEEEVNGKAVKSCEYSLSLRGYEMLTKAGESGITKPLTGAERTTAKMASKKAQAQKRAAEVLAGMGKWSKPATAAPAPIPKAVEHVRDVYKPA